MLLAIDVKNKNTNFGIFKEDKLLTKFSVMTDIERTVEEIKLTLKLILMDRNMKLSDVDEIIISSVVPELNQTYDDLSKEVINKSPKFISAGLKIGLNIKCENPKDVGSDRVIRAVAASRTYNNNIILVSASSITTIDYINDKKEFIGGLIIPGIELFQKSLYQESSKLPKIDIKKEEKIIGNNTITAMQRGIYFGYRNAVLGIINDISEVYHLDKSNTTLVLTGPYSEYLKTDKFEFTVNDTIALNGLNIINNLNRNK